MSRAALDAGRRLVARSRPIDDPGDVLDHLSPGGFAWVDGDAGFVTAGVAAVVAPTTAGTVVRGFEHECEPGTPAAAGPRAVGALPFHGIGRLVVPALIVAREADGQAWCTTVSDVDAPPDPEAWKRTAGRFDVRAVSGFEAWDAMVREALGAIERRALDKVVLARAVDIHADAPFDRRAVLAHLRATQPGCRVYADGGFVGASPENLVTRHDGKVVCRPLAGTGRDPAALAASAKDAWEHALVVDDVTKVLHELCTDVVVDGPHAIQLADVSHLATTLTGRAAVASALDLARALHPTPAVGGAPRRDALRLIGRLERFDRGRYAGPCGWVDASGDGEFVVALRCGDIDGDHARIYAGAGIVAGSDPRAEWEETQAKLDPMLRALVRV